MKVLNWTASLEEEGLVDDGNGGTEWSNDEWLVVRLATVEVYREPWLDVWRKLDDDDVERAVARMVQKCFQSR